MTKAINERIREKSRVTKEEWREYTKTVWTIANTSRDDHPAVFPEEIPLRLAKLFSFYGETILDPFAGTGTTARAVIPIGRRAVCVDQNSDYVRTITKEGRKLHNGHGPDFEPLVAMHADSRKLDFIKDGSVGLIVTSPPYWNKANYGTGEDNLGNIASYASFLESTRPVFEECFRVLTPGRKYLCRDGQREPAHRSRPPHVSSCYGFRCTTPRHRIRDGQRDHLVEGRFGRKMGIIWHAAPDIRKLSLSAKFSFQERSRDSLIFAKPPLAKTKGPKVKPYKDLMAGMERLVYSEGPGIGGEPPEPPLQS